MIQIEMMHVLVDHDPFWVNIEDNHVVEILLNNKYKITGKSRDVEYNKD